MIINWAWKHWKMYFLSSASRLAAILICYFIHHSHSSPKTSFCQGLPAGQYCSNDLQGYHDCRKGSSSQSGTLKTCGKQKRCICQFKKKCTVPISEICQQLVEPLPYVRNLMISGFAEETTKPAGGVSTTRRIHGIVFNNEDSGKFRFEKWFGTSGDPKSYFFEYFIKNSNGDGKYTRVCFFFEYLYLFIS